jgi:preprotein translocase SecE subunit
VAKTRAQRKAERRAREEQQRRQQGGADPALEQEAEARAQQDTQLGVSGEVAEFEAAVDTGQNIPDDGQPVAGPSPTPVPGVTGDTGTPPPPQAPAPSRADAPPPAKEKKPTRREQRRLKKEEEDKAKRQAESEARLKSKAKTAEAPERRRGGVMAFFASCWAELKRVQWPDRDTLVQASAVTLVFVAVMAAYLGALDAVFNFLIKRII